MFFAPQRRSRAPAPEDAPADAESTPTQLLQRLARGEPEALDGLYRREAGRVYRYALALCGNTAWAADATQEAFVALATRPQGFDPSRGQIGAYLAGVARHALAARWRELRREEPLAESDEPALADAGAQGTADAAAGASHLGAAVSPETLLVRTQELQALWAALRSLPMVFREAVVLVDLQERPYAEAAQIAGIELNTLRTRLHRARVRLAALLGADGACSARRPEARGTPK